MTFDLFFLSMASRSGYSQDPADPELSYNLYSVLMPMILPSQLFFFRSLMLALPAIMAVDGIAGLTSEMLLGSIWQRQMPRIIGLGLHKLW